MEIVSSASRLKMMGAFKDECKQVAGMWLKGALLAPAVLIPVFTRFCLLVPSAGCTSAYVATATAEVFLQRAHTQGQVDTVKG